MTGDPAEVVVAGYERLAARYDDWAARVTPELRLGCLDWLDDRLPPASPVLELGSGTGVPVAARLASRYRYLGVDASPAMTRLARANAPAGEFMVADMRELDLPPGSFDAAVAFYSIIHVPRDDHPALYASVHRWLRPGGYLVAALGTRDDPGAVEDDWLGAGPMFWSGHAPGTALDLLTAAGFTILSADVRRQWEPDAEVEFLFVTARRDG